ncbi:MAG: peptidase M22 [Ruminococcus sp.]|nr:peptidase M22 [Ruminococcus sp.]
MSNGFVLGIDTSNYTCSAAIYDLSNGRMYQSKQLLPVKEGEKGVRQSDAVFHHTVLLPQILEPLSDKLTSVVSVGVSDRPSCRRDSYMPCFMTGLGTAKAIAAARGVAFHPTTHQTGHILAALYSADILSLVKEKREFIAFHVSGGTTDMLLCRPDDERLLDIKRIGGSSDLKAGQAIDRCGVMLGLRFPCGAELEKLAQRDYADIRVKPTLRGLECSLSGIENKCKKLFDEGADNMHIAAFCLRSVAEAIDALTSAALEEYGSGIPVIYAGGVMSDKLIADQLAKRDNVMFAAPEFSCDNAAGVALYAAFVEGLV